MNHIHLNIGLNVAGVEALQMPHIAVALEQVLPGMKIVRSFIRQSATEKTACIVLECDAGASVVEDAIYNLCDVLGQEAIAGRHFVPWGMTRDFLVGPCAEAWGGVFNADHWLAPLPDNAPLAAADALAALRPDHETRGYTMGMKGPGMVVPQIAGWFERNSDGTGGELLFEIEDNRLVLVDYDGVACLPAPVLTWLREAGVDADKDFE